MMPETQGDPRFPRTRCQLCSRLCVAEQTGQYLLARADSEQRAVVTLCNVSNAGAPAFNVSCAETIARDVAMKVERIA